MFPGILGGSLLMINGHFWSGLLVMVVTLIAS